MSDFSDIAEIELKRTGFGIADKSESADAVLYLKDLAVEITLHGRRNDIPKHFYEFELKTSSGEVVWMKKIIFLDQGSKEKNNKLAGEKLAETLFDDRQKAQKKSK